MKKLLSSIFILTVLIFTLSSCTGSDEIHYSVNEGTKIESLSTTEQELIDEYVQDCKTIFTANYTSQRVSYGEDDQVPSYISFTDTFVYDFRNLNESTMDKSSLALWNKIRELSESKPIMYIELNGYAPFWLDYYTVTSLQLGSVQYGYFIFEDESVVPYNYKYVCNTLYNYKLPNGTETINCGDKYAEEKSWEELLDFYSSAVENYSSINGFLDRLHIVKQ